MPEDAGFFASTTLPRHLTRGVLGFGLLCSALVLTPSLGPSALVFAPPGLIALRGCPMCWTLGLIETISARRLQRTCTPESCGLQSTISHVRPRNPEAIEFSRSAGVTSPELTLVNPHPNGAQSL
jgi:hypothetical protein